MNYCPHCFARAKAAYCTTCTREMCEQCISHHPSVGPMCGLCLDRKTEADTARKDAEKETGSSAWLCKAAKEFRDNIA